MRYLLLLLMTACAFDPETDQKLVMDKNIQPMGRNEVIDAIKQCEKKWEILMPTFRIFARQGFLIDKFIEAEDIETAASELQIEIEKMDRSMKYIIEEIPETKMRH